MGRFKKGDIVWVLSVVEEEMPGLAAYEVRPIGNIGTVPAKRDLLVMVRNPKIIAMAQKYKDTIRVLEPEKPTRSAPRCEGDGPRSKACWGNRHKDCKGYYGRGFYGGTARCECKRHAKNKEGKK